MMEIFKMGEYGAFVWSSYLLTVIVIAVAIWQGMRRHHRISAEIRRQLTIKETEQ